MRFHVPFHRHWICKAFRHRLAVYTQERNAKPISKPYIVCHMMMPIDGLPMEHRPVALKLESATSYEDDTVWLRYSFDR